MTTEPNPADGALALELDRAHVFHSWSAQGALNPFVDRRRIRHRGVGLRRQALPRLLEPARQHQHRAHASEGRRRRSRSRRPCCRRSRPAHANLARGEAAKRILAKAGHGVRQGVLHQRRCGCERERDPDGAPHDRPRQGAEHLPQLPRQHRRGGRRDRRLAPRAERVRPRSRALLRTVPVPHRVLGRDARAGVGARAAPPRARHPVRGRHRRSRRSCSRASPARPACSCRRPATSRGCGRSATTTASCSSSTRSCRASAAPATGSPGRTRSSTRRASCPT